MVVSSSVNDSKSAGSPVNNNNNNSSSSSTSNSQQINDYKKRSTLPYTANASIGNSSNSSRNISGIGGSGSNYRKTSGSHSTPQLQGSYYRSPYSSSKSYYSSISGGKGDHETGSSKRSSSLINSGYYNRQKNKDFHHSRNPNEPFYNPGNDTLSSSISSNQYHNSANSRPARAKLNPESVSQIDNARISPDSSNQIRAQDNSYNGTNSNTQPSNSKASLSISTINDSRIPEDTRSPLDKPLSSGSKPSRSGGSYFPGSSYTNPKFSAYGSRKYYTSPAEKAKVDDAESSGEPSERKNGGDSYYPSGSYSGGAYPKSYKQGSRPYFGKQGKPDYYSGQDTYFSSKYNYNGYPSSYGNNYGTGYSGDHVSYGKHGKSHYSSFNAYEGSEENPYNLPSSGNKSNRPKKHNNWYGANSSAPSAGKESNPSASNSQVSSPVLSAYDDRDVSQETLDQYNEEDGQDRKVLEHNDLNRKSSLKSAKIEDGIVRSEKGKENAVMSQGDNALTKTEIVHKTIEKPAATVSHSKSPESRALELNVKDNGLNKDKTDVANLIKACLKDGLKDENVQLQTAPEGSSEGVKGRVLKDVERNDGKREKTGVEEEEEEEEDEDEDEDEEADDYNIDSDIDIHFDDEDEDEKASRELNDQEDGKEKVISKIEEVKEMLDGDDKKDRLLAVNAAKGVNVAYSKSSSPASGADMKKLDRKSRASAKRVPKRQHKKLYIKIGEGCVFPLNRLEQKLFDLKNRPFEETTEHQRYLLKKPIVDFSKDLPFYKKNLLIHDQVIKPRLLDTFQKTNKQIYYNKLSLKHEYQELKKIWDLKCEQNEKQLVDIYPDYQAQLFDNEFKSNTAVSAEEKSSSSRRSRHHIADSVTTEAEFEKILQQIKMNDPLYKAEQHAAVIPDMIMNPIDRYSKHFIDVNNLVPDKTLFVKQLVTDPVDNFNREEHQMFVDAYVMYPKKFGKISQLMGGLRSSEECVRHYYNTKRSVHYKQLVSNKRNRKTSTRKKTNKNRSTRRVDSGTNISEKGGSAPPIEPEVETEPLTITFDEKKVKNKEKDVTKSPEKLDHSSVATHVKTKDSNTSNSQASDNNDKKSAKLQTPISNSGEKNSKIAKPSADEQVSQSLEAPTQSSNMLPNAGTNVVNYTVPNKKEHDSKKKEFLSGQQSKSAKREIAEILHSDSLASSEPTENVTDQQYPLNKRVKFDNINIVDVGHSAESDNADRGNNAPASDLHPDFAPNDSIVKLEDAALKDRKVKTVSSYWSVAEIGMFPRLISKYGTQWDNIAKEIGTKTTIMVRNYYSKNADKEGWRVTAEKIDRERDEKGREAFSKNVMQYNNLSQSAFDKYTTQTANQDPKIANAPPLGYFFDKPASSNAYINGPVAKNNTISGNSALLPGNTMPLLSQCQAASRPPTAPSLLGTFYNNGFTAETRSATATSDRESNLPKDGSVHLNNRSENVDMRLSELKSGTKKQSISNLINDPVSDTHTKSSYPSNPVYPPTGYHRSNIVSMLNDTESVPLPATNVSTYSTGAYTQPKVSHSSPRQSIQSLINTNSSNAAATPVLSTNSPKTSIANLIDKPDLGNNGAHASSPKVNLPAIKKQSIFNLLNERTPSLGDTNSNVSRSSTPVNLPPISSFGTNNLSSSYDRYNNGAATSQYSSAYDASKSLLSFKTTGTRSILNHSTPSASGKLENRSLSPSMIGNLLNHDSGEDRRLPSLNSTSVWNSKYNSSLGAAHNTNQTLDTLVPQHMVPHATTSNFDTLLAAAAVYGDQPQARQQLQSSASLSSAHSNTRNDYQSQLPDDHTGYQ